MNSMLKCFQLKEINWVDYVDRRRIIKKRVRRIDEPYKLCYFMSFKKQLNVPYITLNGMDIRNGYFPIEVNLSSLSLSMFFFSYENLMKFSIQ